MKPDTYDAWVAEANDTVKAPPEAIHRFCPSVALEHGIPAALFLEHFRDRCARSGLSWVIGSKSLLSARFPYLGTRRIKDGLEALVTGTQERPALLLRRLMPDQKSLHQFRPGISDHASLDALHTFDAAFAAEIGIVPAIVYAILQQEDLRSGATGDYRDLEVYFAVTQCHDRMPYASRDKIRQCVKMLRDRKLIREREVDGQPTWSLVIPCN